MAPTHIHRLFVRDFYRNSIPVNSHDSSSSSSVPVAVVVIPIVIVVFCIMLLICRSCRYRYPPTGGQEVDVRPYTQRWPQRTPIGGQGVPPPPYSPSGRAPGDIERPKQARRYYRHGHHPYHHSGHVYHNAHSSHNTHSSFPDGGGVAPSFGGGMSSSHGGGSS